MPKSPKSKQAVAAQPPTESEQAITQQSSTESKRAITVEPPTTPEQAIPSKSPKGAKRAKSKKEAAPPLPAPPTDRTNEQNRYALKRKVRMFYDLQTLRIQAGGRGAAKGPGQEVILHEYDVAVLTNRSTDLHQAEARALRDVADHLEQLPFYNNVLCQRPRYLGIGPTLAGVILSEFDIYRADTVSKLWAFAGLSVLPARRCNECHAVVAEDSVATEGMMNVLPGTALYRHVATRAKPLKPGEDAKPDKSIKCSVGPHQLLTHGQTYASGHHQHPTKGEKLSYNSWLRSKLIGVLGPNLLKAGSPFRKFYDDYKHRKESASWGRSDGHRHNAALRYMVKMVLLDIWKEWRAAEKLEVRPSYQEEYLGHTHHEERVG